MLLAEAIAEKEYIEASIDKTNSYIEKLLIGSNKPLLEKKLKELDDLYKKYQQYTITINRTESQALVKMNEMELNLRDARVIKDGLYGKLFNLESMLNQALEANKPNDIVCINIEVLMTDVEEMRRDVKTIENKIQYTIWNTEVKIAV